MKHIKQDLRVVEMQRRAQRDSERTFHPSANFFQPLRRSDGAARDAVGADISTRAQPTPITAKVSTVEL